MNAATDDYRETILRGIGSIGTYVTETGEPVTREGKERQQARYALDELIGQAKLWQRLCDHFADTLIDRWHEPPTNVPTLDDWMGLTEQQYAAWVEQRYEDVL